MSLFPKFIAKGSPVAIPAIPAIREGEAGGNSRNSENSNATIPTPEPPAPGETSEFGQRELDAIRSGFGVWVWSGVLSEWLFWVRDNERKGKALTKGIERWRIWTLDELTAAQGMPPADLRNVFDLKRRFDGTIQPGGKPQRWRDALSPLEPAVAAPPASATDAPATLAQPHHSHAPSAQEVLS